MPFATRRTFITQSTLAALTAALGSWRDGETELPGTPPEWTELVGVDPGPRHPTKIAVAGAWKDAQTDVGTLHAETTPVLTGIASS